MIGAIGQTHISHRNPLPPNGNDPMTMSTSSQRHEDYIVAPPGRSLPLAKFISSIAAPHTLAPMALLLTATTLDSRMDWLWIGFYLLFAVLVPVFYLVWLLRTGRVNDFHLRVRTDRFRPMVVTIVSSGFAWLVLQIGNGPPVLTTVALAAWIQSVLLFVITLRWKISAHGAAAGTLAVLGWKIANPSLGLALAALVPLVGWARVRMRRHTLWQVIGGCVLGSGVVALAFALV
jgi:membrane-associated phospholipid phosphatase